MTTKANLDAALARSRARMQKTIPVTIMLSESDLHFLRKDLFSRLERAARKELKSAKRPATKALESLQQYTPERLNIFLVENCVRNHVMRIVYKAAKVIMTTASK